MGNPFEHLVRDVVVAIVVAFLSGGALVGLAVFLWQRFFR